MNYLGLQPKKFLAIILLTPQIVLCDKSQRNDLCKFPRFLSWSNNNINAETQTNKVYRLTYELINWWCCNYDMNNISYYAQGLFSETNFINYLIPQRLFTKASIMLIECLYHSINGIWNFQSKHASQVQSEHLNKFRLRACYSSGLLCSLYNVPGNTTRLLNLY